MRRILTIFLFFFSISTNTIAQVNIIFDTDFGGDADDLGALAMLNHFVENKECNLLAVMCWSNEKYAVSAIDAVNTYYKNPDIPIAVRKGHPSIINWNHSKAIIDKLPYKHTFNSVPSTTELYRKLLSKAENNSVVIITVGPLKNIENLINSKSDSISPLSGKSLIENKVKEFVIMGGQFPSGEKEWNFDGGMPGVTKYVVKNISAPITYLGYEIGVDVKTGEVFNSLDKQSPLYIGFMHFSKNAPWLKHNFKGSIFDNSTYDQTAILYAVRNGVGKYWTKVYGKCIPDDFGGNKWINDKNSSTSYLKVMIDKKVLEEEIEALMLGEF